MKLSTRLKLIFWRRSIYRALFWDENGQLTQAASDVLADLARFCRVHQSTLRLSPMTGMTDTHATLLREGRREVFNHIAQTLNVSDQYLYSLMEREHGSIQ